MGAPKKPTVIDIAEGNPSRRKRGREPMPEKPAGLPEPPARLIDEAKAVWLEVGPAMFRAGLLTAADLEAWAATCGALGWIRRADGKLLEKLSPRELMRWLSIRKWHVEQFVKLGSRFGMTPSDRAKVAAPPADNDPAETWFKANA